MDENHPRDQSEHGSDFHDLRRRTAAPQSQRELTKPERLGRYEIVSELGRGAMGMVYKAHDPRIDRTVAIKIITIPGGSGTEADEYRKRFFREAQAAGRLSHPGIVTIYDVDEDPTSNTPYIVMEFVPGKRLDTYVAATSEERLPLQATLDLVRQIAQALDYAHAQGVVHRDIKPANIIVTESGRAMITDFGIAKLALTDLTMPGQVLGTPAFMAPEQFTGADVDGRADLFSLGVILYWMLTGVRPFSGESATSVSFKLVYQDPIPPTTIIPSLAPEFDAVVRRALAKAAEQRYQTGEEFAADLQLLSEGKMPIAPSQEAPADRTLVAVPAPLPRPTPPRAQRPKPRQNSSLNSLLRTPLQKWPRNLQIGALSSAVLLIVLGSLGVHRLIRHPAPVEQAKIAAPSVSDAQPQPVTTPPAISSDDDTAPDRTIRVRESKPKPKLVNDRPAASTARATLAKPHLLPTAATPPVVHSKPESKASATLIVDGEHQFRSGLLYVSVDGEKLYQGELTGDRKMLFSKVKGTVFVPIRVPAGKHSIELHVVAEDDHIDATGKTQGEFRENEQRILIFSLAKRSSEIQLAWK